MTNGVCSFPAPSSAQWSCFAWLQTTITLSAQYQNTDCFCQHTMDHQYPAGGSSALSRVTLCGGGCQVSQIWSPPVNSVTCHVWSPGHRDTPPAYLHISPRLHCQCCSLTFSSFYTDQETFDPSLQSPGRHCSTAALPIQWRILNYDK